MWKAYYYLSIVTGMRRGEICPLHWTDVDFDTKKVTIVKSTTLTHDGPIIKEPKTVASTREITVTDETIKRLKDWYEEEKAYYNENIGSWANKDVSRFEDNYIFIQKDGRMIHPTTPSNKFKEIIARHNERADQDNQIKDIKLHALRHTCASLLIEEGVDILTVSKRLGHSKISTTLDIYTHRLKKDDHEATDAMSRILGSKERSDSRKS